MVSKKDYSQIIDEMAIVTDFLFSTAFDGRPDRAEFLVGEVLKYLGYKDFEVVSSKTQVRKSHLLQHDTITDVEVRLESGELLIVEVQLSHPERFTPQRGRYILGSNDVSTLDEGKEYTELPPQILIVISEEDLNNSGLPIVSAKRIIQETGQIFEDGQTIVFVNHENITDQDTSVDRFIKDLFESDYHKILNPNAREILKSYKEEEEGRMQYQGHLEEVIQREVQERLNENQKEIEELRKENHELKELLKENYKLKEKLARFENKMD